MKTPFRISRPVPGLLVCLCSLLLRATTSQAANPDLTYTKPRANDLAGSANYPTALGDLNHDGYADFVRVGGNQVRVQLGDGEGSFGNLTNYAVGALPAFVLIADVNNDGHPDLIVANLNDKTVSVLLGNGNGTFQNQIVSNIGLVATSIAVTDFNKDGKLDLIVTGYPAFPAEGWVSTLTGNGNGTFSNLTTFPTSARTAYTQTRSVAVGDLNGDTWPDFIVSDPGGSAAIVTFLNNHNGTFTRLVEMSVPGNVGRATLADFNGDGKLDLAFLLVSDQQYGNTGPGSNIGVALGNGDGTFGTLVSNGGLLPTMQNVTIYGAGSSPDAFIDAATNIVAADMDGDGKLDLVTVAEPTSTAGGVAAYVAILRGLGNGAFAFGNRVSALDNSRWVSVGEINGDATLDMMVSPNNAIAQPYLADLAETFVVTTLDDSVNAGDGQTSLREAITAAVNFPGIAIVTFAPGLSGTLTMSDPWAGGTTPSVVEIQNPDVRIVGPATGPGITIAVAPGVQRRHFYVSPSSRLTLTRLTLTGSDIRGIGADGGAVLSDGRIDLSETRIVGNKAANGGAISSYGTVNIQNSTFSGNTADANAGALWPRNATTITGSVFDGNSAGVVGGAVVLESGVTVTNCTFAGNTAPQGGAIFAFQESGTGYPQANVTATHVTIFGNTATNNGGGIRNASALVTLVNSIVAGNSGGGSADVSGNLVSSSHHNLLGTGGSGGLTNGTNSNLVGVPANQLQLGSLGNYGGPTRTVPLLTGSPAIDAAVAVSGLTTDQRGASRPYGGAPDMGACERGALSSLVVTTTADENNGNSDPGVGSGTSLREALVYAQSLSGAQTITFDPSLSGQTITLNTGWNDANDANALRINGQIALQGTTNSPGVTVAMASGVQKRHLGVDAGGNLDVSNVTFSGGYGDYSGSIRSLGTLAIHNCTFTGNTATLDGGAIHGDTGSPSLLIENSTFTGNSCTGTYSSAVATGAQQTTLRYLTITGNTATSGGGAVLIYQYPTTMVNSLVDGNTNDGVIQLNGATFSAQSTNNILGSGGTGGLTNGVNGNLTGVPIAQLNLGSLANNGGPTATVALGPGSLAIDAGVAIAGLTADQRGTARLQGAATDIGAFELVPAQATIPIVGPVGGTYANSVQVAITSPSPATSVRYTLDGSDPSETNGQIYSGSFPLTQPATVKALAYGRGWLASPVASVTYSVLAPLPYWRNLQGLAANGSQDLANPSGDGVASLLKYAFNLAPNAGDLAKPNYQVLTPGGTAGLPSINRDTEGRLVIAFVRRKASSNPGIAYVVETSEDLATWNALTLTDANVVPIDATWERVTVADLAMTPNRFGRVRAQLSQ